MTADELLRLIDGRLIVAGAHTLNHAMLGRLSDSDQRMEINEGKRKLEEILGSRVRHFAYPHSSFTAGTQSVLVDAGFESACTTREAATGRRDPIHEVPRVWSQDWDGETFSRRLHRWFQAE